MPRAVSRLAVHRLGRVPYGPTHALQQRLVEARARGLCGDTLLVLEHDPPVITMGRSAKEQNVLIPRRLLASRGVELHEVGRGGDVTFHAPGQVVLYPIVSLSPDREDVRKYVASLEETMIRTCAAFGVTAGRVAGMNGTWVGDEKIGAVGVRISRWVTMHGLALNVDVDLEGFRMIVPCGLAERGVTSLAARLGVDAPTVPQVQDELVRTFAALYDAAFDVVDGPPALPEVPVDGSGVPPHEGS